MQSCRSELTKSENKKAKNVIDKINNHKKGKVSKYIFQAITSIKTKYIFNF